MPTVAVREAVNAHQTMFKPQHCFIRRVGRVFMPITHIVEQCSQLRAYLPCIYTNVFVARAKLSCPCPHIAEHALVQQSDKCVIK